MINTLKLKNPLNGHNRHGISCEAAQPLVAMVIIHGFGEHCERYRPMMTHLAAQGISSLAIDLEGHGRSDGKRGVCHNYDVLRADVTLALNETRKAFPDLPVILYGHSMGGGLVLNYGLQDAPDVKAYIASAPLIRPAEPVPGPLRVIVKILRRIAPNLTLGNAIDGSKVTTIPSEQQTYEQDPLNHGRLGVGLAVDIIEGGEWVAQNAGQWRVPLLLMHARTDQLTSFEASETFAGQASQCTFLPADNCEHEMHNDVTREDIYAAMTDFIKAQI